MVFFSFLVIRNSNNNNINTQVIIIIWGGSARLACSDSAGKIHVFTIRMVLLGVGWAPFTFATCDFYFWQEAKMIQFYPTAFAVFSYENPHAFTCSALTTEKIN